MVLPIILFVVAIAFMVWLLVNFEKGRRITAVPGKAIFHLLILSLAALTANLSFTQSAFAISAACSEINAGTVLSSNTGMPATLSGTYSVSSWEINSNSYSNYNTTFEPGDKISYSISAVSSPAPYIHVLLEDEGYIQPGSVRNAEGAQSGTILISTANSYLHLATSSFPIDATGSATHDDDELARYGSSAVITVSCIPAASPTIDTISPSSGPMAGGPSATITGTNFSATAANNIVKFGSNAATVTAATSTQLTVTVPAGATGAVNVSVEVDGLTAISNNAYTYLPPTLSGISPASGPTAGGTAVTITGTNFSTTPANNIVKFGSATATVNNATATQLTVTTAASTAGTANVSVTVGSETATLSNAYTYVGPPVTGPVSATVGTGSSSNPITLALSGDAATSVSVVTEPSNGTATAAGTSITYTPAPGYVGSDGFTYRAGNEGGTSNTSTVTIT